MSEKQSRVQRCLEMLARWAKWAERDRCPRKGYYGTGYNSWGVQTNQKYVAGLAALAALGSRESDRAWATERALAALRFSLSSHHTGDGACTDGTRWGRTWISALGIERMMFGVRLLEPWLSAEDRADVRRVLIDESAWIADHLIRGKFAGVQAGLWNVEGKNNPESNIWNGALVWRSAAMYADDPRAEQWREMAHRLLINGVSVASDADDDTLIAGRPVRERHVGANFFPNFGLDHHGYFNLGYMVICVSNAAILHFDMKQLGLPAPGTLHHHQADLWQVTRRMIFADGRLARIGGDSRVRYTYCQDYLLPSLLYAADHLGDGHAMSLVDGMLNLIGQEQDAHGSGAFYAGRLTALDRSNVYYTTRLEADRACVLGMTAAYLASVDMPATPVSSFESSVAGGWDEPEHGAVVHRSPRRLASFAWRANGLGQGMCQPPDDGHLADWQHNLAGCVRFMGDRGESLPPRTVTRSLKRQHVQSFAGGFATLGTIVEGHDLIIDEGMQYGSVADHHLAIVALPDECTVVGLQLCRVNTMQAYVTEILGLHLNVPNDLFNGYRRTLHTAGGEVTLRTPAECDGCVPLASSWANVDGRIGVVGLYGAETLSVLRSRQRRGGRYASLYVDSIGWPATMPQRPILSEAGSVVLDVGWAVLSGVGPRETAELNQNSRNARLTTIGPDARGVTVRARDGRTYGVIANFSDELLAGVGVGAAVDGIAGGDVGGWRVRVWRMD